MIRVVTLWQRPVREFVSEPMDRDLVAMKFYPPIALPATHAHPNPASCSRLGREALPELINGDWAWHDLVTVAHSISAPP